MHFRNHLLAGLSARARVALAPHLRPVQLSADQVVMDDGVAVEEVCFPEGAVLSCVKGSADGGVIEVGMIGAEGVAGLMPCLSETPATVRTVTKFPGAALMLKSSVLRSQAWRDADLKGELLVALAMEARQSGQAAACNALHDAPSRVARWLLATQDRIGSDAFPLTQEYMALMLGLQRTTTNAIALHLKKSGVISYRRGAVHIRDRSRLMDQACECYHPGEGRQAGRPERLAG